MFCMKCGREMPDDAKFCPHCGQEADAQFHSYGRSRQNDQQTSQKTVVDADAFAGSTTSSDTYGSRSSFSNPKTIFNEVFLHKYACFKGRACRSEYWFFLLYYLLGMFALCIIGALFMTAAGSDAGSFMFIGLLGIYVVAAFIPGVALCVRRMHDLNHSGWWVLIFYLSQLIPVADVIVSIGFLIFMCIRGTAGPNRFGEDPLA